MKFTKMHGLGNDYIYVNGFSESVPDPISVAVAVSDRHFGIGSDGLILILPSDQADVRMRMFNVDGSEGEMCGNGVRCVAKYAFDHGLTTRNPMTVETGKGVLSISLETDNGKVRRATVNMGPPILDLAKIPVNPEKITRTSRAHEYRMHFPATNEIMDATFVSMGNPHVVVFTRDVQAIDLPRIGPLMEHHPAFPRRANCHWAQVFSNSEVSMRTWERGSGITLACGTGACSVCVAGRTDRKIVAHLPGGDLELEWRESDNNLYMTGPATEVFSGEWNG
jgi:diaminopimelate epimerase